MSTTSAIEWLDRGRAARLEGRLAEARECFETALRLDPGSARGHAGYAATLDRLGEPARAVESYWQSLRLDAGNARVFHALGALYMRLACPETAVDCYREALRLDPSDEFNHSSLLFALNFDERATPDEIYRAHAAYGERFGSAARAPHDNLRDPERPLRVGYVSGDYWDHACSNFFEPVLRHRSSDAFHITLYSTAEKEDAVTERLRGLADAWRAVSSTSDDDLARMVREDAIDILVDLAGHTDGWRPGLFARKPAPVQVTYLGYPNTTGLRAIDYRFTDACADPPAVTDHWHSEELVRLPRCFLCFRTPAEAPEIRAARANPTFGSCSMPLKWSSGVIAVWAEILRQMPDSHLLLHHSSATLQEVRARVTHAFFSHGISPGRIEIEGRLGPRDHREWYGEVDIALDPFPYNGTTATCETLWMGVPVVALAGEAHVSRVSVSLLGALGLDHLVARTTEEYIAIAVGLARDPQALSALRLGMRDRMTASPLLDGPGFMRDLEAAYRRIWRLWASGARNAV